MAAKYQQFLGTAPGQVIELIDDSGSPYLVGTQEGFRFYVSPEDFRNYYRELGQPTDEKWGHLITNPQDGTVESELAGKALEIVNHFIEPFQDFESARCFVRDALRLLRSADSDKKQALTEWIGSHDRKPSNLTDKELGLLLTVPEPVAGLLLGDTCAVLQLPNVGVVPRDPSGPGDENGPVKAPRSPAAGSADKGQKPAPKGRRVGMKNVEMLVNGDQLTLIVDLSRDFGPSKSGKTVIIASTEGNKSVPGRSEVTGLNVYKQPDGKAAKGHQRSFNNVEMDVDGEILSMKIDLSKEMGPSKSGKTIIIASTGGNRLVYGREEKVGLNVYRKIE